MSTDRFRCDGCGESTDEGYKYLQDDGTVVAKYCLSCEGKRNHYHIQPGDHPQYRLIERVREIEEKHGGSE
jgi:recombinational DNA repair protein (RecF pathway)